MTRNESLRKIRTLAAVVPHFTEAVSVWLETAAVDEESHRELIRDLANELRAVRADIIARRVEARERTKEADNKKAVAVKKPRRRKVVA